MNTIITIYLIFINAIGFVLMLTDKIKAMKKSRRISEKALLLTAAVGGAAGSLIGMYIFRHKTKHMRFVLLVPLFLLIHISLIVIWHFGII